MIPAQEAEQESSRIANQTVRPDPQETLQLTRRVKVELWSIEALAHEQIAAAEAAAGTEIPGDVAE